MVQFFLNIYDYLKRKRSLCFGLLAGITILLIVMTAVLKYNENIYDFLPISGKQQRAMALYQDITGGQRVIALFSANPSATAAPSNAEEQITQAIDTFANIITSSRTKHISEVMSQIDFEELSGITDFIYGNIPLMLSDSDYTHIEQIISTPQGVEEQLSQDVTMMMLPSTGFISSNIGKDPLNIFSSVMDRLQQALSSMPVEYDNGYIYTPGRKFAVVMMTSPYGAMESANNNLLVNYIDSVAQETSKVFPNVKISFTGAPVIAVGNAVRIKKDSQWAVSIAVTLIIFLLIYSFRKTKNLLFIGVTILFGWLFAMGFISVIRSNVSLIVLGIGSVIIGIAVNYPLHFVAHTESAHSMRQLLKEMVPPLLIGNITTVGAFAALMPLNSPALRDLGFFAAFMLIGTILFVLIFLPHLVKTRQSEQTERLSFGRLSAASPEKHQWLLWITIILTIVFAYFSTGVSFDTNIQNINYISKEQKQLLADLNVSAGILDTSNLYLVAEGESWDKALSQ
ncbi:MAG: MMPL family transporter, partial [Bacteroidales bacterium]|nr:MMPL family transporter [Bacteroidales bacterium]